MRWETRRCSKQGVFTIGGVHRYSAGPAYAGREVAVALGAFDVTVCDASTGEVVATYEREWGEAPTDSSDPTLQLRLLCARPAGWRDSSVRASLPAELVSFLDAEPPADLAADLRVLRDESDERVEYDEEVDLGVYDGALRLLEGGDRRAADELGA